MLMVTIYLIVYITLFQLNGPGPIIACLFLISPFLVIWMVYVVITDQNDYPDLPEGDEWGYLDRPGYNK